MDLKVNVKYLLWFFSDVFYASFEMAVWQTALLFCRVFLSLEHLIISN